VQDLDRFKMARFGASRSLNAGQNGAVAQVADKAKGSISELERRAGKGGALETLQSAMIPAKAYTEYKKALSEMRPAVKSRVEAYEAARQVYSEDPTTGQSPFYVAYRAVGTLEDHYHPSPVWGLVLGPISDLWAVVQNKATCQLQQLWEKQVLSEIQPGADQKAVNELLLGEEGYAQKFIRGPAAPFLSRESKKGYYPAVAFGSSIAFEPSFLSFMTRGVRSRAPLGKTYKVSVKGLPTDANSEATLKPHGTRLEVNCAEKAVTLVNLHYPVAKTFNWSPQNCGDVTFQILVGDVVLTKTYKGYRAFPEFLDDFKNGERTFHPDDFPEQASAIKRYGIKRITAKYRFEGHSPLLELLKLPPGEVPRTIVKCWAP
jgi:type VI secretion system protein ImpL